MKETIRSQFGIQVAHQLPLSDFSILPSLPVTPFSMRPLKWTLTGSHDDRVGTNPLHPSTDCRMGWMKSGPFVWLCECGGGNQREEV